MTIEKLRNQYYEAIDKLQDKEDIKNALPKPEYKVFFELIKGIIEKIDESIKEIENILSTETEQEVLEYLKEELELYKFKKEVCIDLYKEGKETEKIEELANKTKRKHIIFAKTESGNIYISKDLKDIPTEEYKDVLKCIERIETEEKSNNNEKGKSYGSNNAKIAGIKVEKEYQKRLYYKTLTPDTVYVMLLIAKKDDYISIDRNTLINRNQKTLNEFKKLKIEMQDEKRKQEIIEENEKIKEDLFSSFKKRKRD